MRTPLLLLALVAGLLPGGWAPPARGQGGGEFSADELRLAIVSKLPPYIAWPDAPAEQPIVLGVLGEAVNWRLLEELLRDVRVRQRTVQVRAFASAAEVEGVQILYVPAAFMGDVAALPPERLRGVVTVGEDPRFLRQGGIINLQPDAAGGKINLQVSLRNARAQGIRIQTPLLRIAEVVDR